MSQIFRFPGGGRRSPFVHFDRRELTLLLGVYSRRVASGEWRDYAIANGPGRAVFAVFRHANEHPLFTIAKIPGTRGERYVIANGRRPLRQGQSLADVLDVLDGPRLGL